MAHEESAVLQLIKNEKETLELKPASVTFLGRGTFSIPAEFRSVCSRKQVSIAVPEIPLESSKPDFRAVLTCHGLNPIRLRKHSSNEGDFQIISRETSVNLEEGDEFFLAPGCLLRVKFKAKRDQTASVRDTASGLKYQGVSEDFHTSGLDGGVSNLAETWKGRSNSNIEIVNISSSSDEENKDPALPVPILGRRKVSDRNRVVSTAGEDLRSAKALEDEFSVDVSRKRPKRDLFLSKKEGSLGNREKFNKSKYFSHSFVTESAGTSKEGWNKKQTLAECMKKAHDEKQAEVAEKELGRQKLMRSKAEKKTYAAREVRNAVKAASFATKPSGKENNSKLDPWLLSKRLLEDDDDVELVGNRQAKQRIDSEVLQRFSVDLERDFRVQIRENHVSSLRKDIEEEAGTSGTQNEIRGLSASLIPAPDSTGDDREGRQPVTAISGPDSQNPTVRAFPEPPQDERNELNRALLTNLHSSEQKMPDNLPSASASPKSSPKTAPASPETRISPLSSSFTSPEPRKRPSEAGVDFPSAKRGGCACAICCEDDSAAVSGKLPCGHSFCLACIWQWSFQTTAKQPLCPLCKAPYEVISKKGLNSPETDPGTLVCIVHEKVRHGKDVRRLVPISSQESGPGAPPASTCPCCILGLSTVLECSLSESLEWERLCFDCHVQLSERRIAPPASGILNYRSPLSRSTRSPLNIVRGLQRRLALGPEVATPLPGTLVEGPREPEQGPELGPVRTLDFGLVPRGDVGEVPEDEDLGGRRRNGRPELSMFDRLRFGR